MAAWASRPIAVIEPTAAIAVALLASNAVRELWLERLEWPRGVSWLYLPAALRPLAVLLFGWRGALGLLVGGLLTVAAPDPMPLHRGCPELCV